MARTSQTAKNRVKGKGEDALHREGSDRKFRKEERDPRTMGWTTCIKCKTYAAMIIVHEGIKCANCGCIHTGKTIPNLVKAVHTGKRMTMKYLELEPEESFTYHGKGADFLTEDLYQVTQDRKQKGDFHFTKVTRVLGDIELTPEQYQIVEKIMELEEIQTVEDFVRLSILYHIYAEVDHHFRGEARAKYMKVADDAIKELTAV